MEARKFLLRTLDTYLGLESYQDDGYVTTTDQTGTQVGGQTTFNTAFVSPKLFRFAFVVPHPYEPLAHVLTKSVCGYDGAQAYTATRFTNTPPQIRLEESMEMAIGGATGVSSMSASNIASLLGLIDRQHALRSLTDVTFADDAPVDGVRCVQLRGVVLGVGLTFNFSIEPSTQIVRKIVTNFLEYTTIEIRRRIRLNESILASRFAIDGEVT